MKDKDKDNRKVCGGMNELSSPMRGGRRSSQGSQGQGQGQRQGSVFSPPFAGLEDTVRVRSNSDSTVSDRDRTTEVNEG